ncbi:MULTISPECIES: ribokinase [unclassified Virgibacillus]|uniref:ribokinase n=1 Tax=unclassified Virgibacillus TaxID=2620237 RepID=UPI0024DEBF61|nr:ribokinase [Virgibacillus sp. LDC-1]
MKKILVFGSLNMDLSIEAEQMPRNGETIDGKDFYMTPGGKGANQAVAAQKNGASTFMIGTVGDDIFGNQLVSALNSYGVDCQNVTKTKEASTGVAIITRHKGDNRIILSAGANYITNNTDILNAINTLTKEGDIFLTQFESDFDTVVNAITTAKRHGLYTIFNPAPAKQIPITLYKEIDLLVVNQWENQMLTNIYPETESDCKKSIEYYLEHGVQSVIITLGANGSVFGSHQQFIFVPSMQVTSVDTTAAGDTYIGTLASSLAMGRPIKESMQYATKAAAITISKQGAQESIPYKEEVEQFKEEKHDE